MSNFGTYYAGEHNVYFGGLRHLFHLANNFKYTTDDCYAAFSDTRYVFSALDNVFLKTETEIMKFLNVY